MKKLLMSLVMAATVFSCAPSYAQEEDQLCTMLGAAANQIMTDRQEGVPMDSQLARVDAVSLNSPTARSLLYTLVITAYQVPRVVTREDQAEVSLQFQELVEETCFGEVS